jgi:hypothetical protein
MSGQTTAAKAHLATYIPTLGYFSFIAEFFVSGSELLHDYIYNAHHAFTYYTAVKHGLFR